jgi:hypothetical protein
MYSEDVSNRNTPEQTIERLRLALELYRAGERMMRMKLRREHPSLDDAQIERKLVAWLQTR